MKLVHLWLFVLLPAATYAELHPEPWMQKEDPSKIWIYSQQDDNCPFSDSELRSKVDLMIVFADLEPEKPIRGRLFLSLVLSCKILDQAEFLYSVDVDFAIYRDDALMFYVPGYGTIAIGDKANIESDMDDSLFEALMDYSKANALPLE